MDVSYEISAQELSVELLPAREALGAANVSDVAAKNTAVALNFGDHGEANADANQKIDVNQDGDDHGKDHGKDHHDDHHCKK